VKDLGAAGRKTKDDKGNEVVEVDIPTAPDDIDELWLAMKKEVSVPAPVKHEKRSIDGESSCAV
jgi:chitin synthase